MTESLKFGRLYAITFEHQVLTSEGASSGVWVSNGDPILVVSYPLTAQFSVIRNAGGGFSTLDMQIFNLSEDTRRKIFQDRAGYNVSDKSYGSTRVVLYAGYRGDFGNDAVDATENIAYNTLPIIFIGRLFEAGSTRRGSDVVTYIHATDGMQEAVATQTYKTWRVSTRSELLLNLAKEFKNLDLGAIFDDKSQLINRPISITGNTYEAIQRYCDGHVNIDLGKIYILRDIDVINEVEILIDASTGLLETPRRDDSYVELTTLFEPRLAISQKVKVVSTVQPEYNGVYKVYTLKHDCVISGSVGGTCKTIIGLNTEGRTFGTGFNTVNMAVNK